MALPLHAGQRFFQQIYLSVGGYKMNKRFKGWLLSFVIALPLVFVLLFLGYFPVQYEIVLRTDNVVGEGICQTYVCPHTGFAPFYSIGFYFGSELKKATIRSYHYDVKQIELITADVSEYDIISIDSYIKGIHVAHLNAEDILPEGETLEGTKSRLSTQNGLLHVDIFDPKVGSTISVGAEFIPMWFWAVYFIVMLLITVVLSFLFNNIFKHLPVLCMPLMSAACIAVALLVGCFFCGSLPYVTYVNFLLNWLFLFALSLLLNAVTLPFLGTVLTVAFTTFWYIANYFVILFRSKPIMPADLKAIGTAKEVMGGYNFTPTWKMMLGVAVVILYAVLLVITWKKDRSTEKQPLKTRLVRRAVSAAAAVLLMVIGVNTQTFKSLDSFAWDMVLLKSFHEEGMVTTYLKSAFNSIVREPEGYSRELVKSYLAEYQEEQKTEGIQPTNIIMVMNEAFADLRTVGMNPAIDVMPFIDSLDENTVEGSLYVGVFGGGTCNTEFEALTGNTLAFLGPGAYPYTENVTEPMFSLARYFKDMGYIAESFHANDPQNWNRNMVYPNLGFEAFHSIGDYNDFDELTNLHNLPADISDYRYIEAVDEKYAESPRFLFNVTMQNHAGYERWLDVEKAESVAENGSDLYVDTQIYLSLIKASDEEVQQLVETYQNIEEPTMIIFFGDHQPSLPQVAIDELYTGLHSYLDNFKSKFFIWTNYESPKLHNAGLSANYLPWLILDQGNFPMPPYIQMLEEVYAKYPVISSQGVIDIEGNVYTGVAEVMDDPLIQKYQYIQYANLFDEIDPEWFQVR